MNSLRRQQGFTLIEVITVMLVLVAIASITVESSKDFVFQNRYDITKDRYEKIKKAIIGDPNQVINGQPTIEGFVKNVGRLPFALQELLDGHFCSDTRYFTQATCESATPPQTWLPTPNWQKSYISSTKAFDDITAIPDGWGNTGTGNYGWEVSFKDNTGTPTNIIANAVSMDIQSKGKNGVISIADDGYDEDYPKATALPSIKHSDWTVDISALKILVNSVYNGSCSLTDTCSNPSLADNNICSGKNKLWNSANSLCTVAVFTTQIACEADSFIWNSANNLCVDSRYTTETSCVVNNHNWKNHRSKANCEVSGGQWTPTQKNIQLKVNAVLSADTPLITEDGRENLIAFNFASNVVPMGAVSIGVYYASDTNLSYPSICINTSNHANFTQANCEANTGTWKNDSIEQYCYGLTTATACTTTLNGTLKPDIKLTLYPNITLPTINW